MKIAKTVVAFLGVATLWITLSLYGGVSGWWLTPIAEEKDVDAFIVAAKKAIRLKSNGNVALIVMTDGIVVAEDYSASKDPVDENTLFPLASISKLLTAFGVMQLVEEGKLNLDEPISNYLTRWNLPESQFDNDKVTARQLLSHTSGLIDGLGFGDFEPDEKIPTLEESLREPKAANGPKVIKLGREPGSEWDYSGGGYLILELLVEETSGMSFETWMRRSVFTPLNMDRTTYHYLGEQDNRATSYHIDGRPAISYRYASAAATGLSSTPADLVKFAQTLMNTNYTDGEYSQESNIAKAMRQAHGQKLGADIWGLGTMLYAPVSDGEYLFGHDGANDPAINTAFRINPTNNDAIIILATGNKTLASSIAYEWTLWQSGYPDFLALDKAIRSAILPGGIGLVLTLLGFIAFLFGQRWSMFKGSNM